MRACIIAVWTVLASSAVIAPSATLAKGGKFNEVLSIGEKAPDRGTTERIQKTGRAIRRDLLQP